MFADFDEEHADAKSKAVSLSKGELDVLHLGNAERSAYVHAVEAVKPTGLPLELAAKEYTEAWKVLGGKASVIEAAKEFARRHLHTRPGKMLPDAVKKMLEAKERAWLPKDHDGISMVPKFKEKAGDIEIFTPQEVAHFLTYSRQEMVPFPRHRRVRGPAERGD